MTRQFDSACYLDNQEAVAEYVTAAAEGGDSKEFAMVFVVVAKARGISDLLPRTGVSRG
ncbi:helix-turn-helix domain-containing transcriptional regulator [Rhizobium rhizogenes]|uniref:helix-turn-helix domain-containing transcriptional regulator n=1 Tax=Rhizobium rhizogenes TaxID=359 RepID=UPI0035ABCF5E